MSNGWYANSFPRYEEYSKPLGPPSGPAQRIGKGQYFRDFLHLNVSLDTTAKTATVTWKGGIPPPIRPPPGCKAWNCSCQGMTDTFGELLLLCIHSLENEVFLILIGNSRFEKLCSSESKRTGAIVFPLTCMLQALWLE